MKEKLMELLAKAKAFAEANKDTLIKVGGAVAGAVVGAVVTAIVTAEPTDDDLEQWLDEEDEPEFIEE